MGTRSTVKFYRTKHTQKQKVCIASIYQQYDGYLSGVGKELIDYLKQYTIVNGIGLNDNRKIANGIDCLSAQYIRDHKLKIGGLYMTTENDSQEYNYEIYNGLEKGLYIKAKNYEKEIIFEGYLNKIDIDQQIIRIGLND